MLPITNYILLYLLVSKGKESSIWLWIFNDKRKNFIKTLNDVFKFYNSKIPFPESVLTEMKWVSSRQSENIVKTLSEMTWNLVLLNRMSFKTFSPVMFRESKFIDSLILHEQISKLYGYESNGPSSKFSCGWFWGCYFLLGELLMFLSENLQLFWLHSWKMIE